MGLVLPAAFRAFRFREHFIHCSLQQALEKYLGARTLLLCNKVMQECRCGDSDLKELRCSTIHHNNLLGALIDVIDLA